MSTHPLDGAKQHWQKASATHLAALAGVRAAEEALERLQGLIADEAAKLTAAQAGQRAGILAAFGLGGKADESQQSVGDIRAHLDAFESVLPEHQQALQQAQDHAKQTDEAVKAAERGILAVKTEQAVQAEAQAFEGFKTAHLKLLAAGQATKSKDIGLKMGPGYWVTRLYGDRVHLDYFVPTVPEMAQILIHQAEQGE